jgi:hypothetical protein
MAALALDLTYDQWNDATTLVLTDTTTNWGDNDDGDVDVTDPDELYLANGDPQNVDDYSLELDITVASPSGTVTYDTIDLVLLSAPGTTPAKEFVTQSQMVYEITADVLEVGGVAMGESGDELDNGVYKITYTLYSDPWSQGGGKVAVDQLVEYIPVFGNIKKTVFDQIRLANTIYEQTNEDAPVYSRDFEDILGALNKFALLLGAESKVSLATQEKVVNTLDTLERLTIND